MSYTQTEYAMLKADLGFYAEPPAAVGAYMQQLLDVALRRLKTDGVAVDQTDPEDEALVVMYAAWLYRKRDAGGAMPPMLRLALHDRKVREAVDGG